MGTTYKAKIKDNFNNKYQYDLKTPADFETAITATGFGWFNILLLLVGCPAAIASVFETAVVSYVLPSAECDLGLDLLDKGILNAMTYSGMIISAIPWGYVADTRGRKSILVWGLLADVLCVLCCALSQSIIQLMIAKFIGGFIMGGPFAVLMTYLTEFHNNKYRARVMMCIGIMFSLASLTMPILALLVLPQNWDFQVWIMQFHSWQMYLAICAMPSLISGIALSFFPESPRFLMSQGRTAEALKALRTIYALNTGYSKDTYPITSLVDESLKAEEQNVEEICISTIEHTVKDSYKDSIDVVKPKEPSPFLALFQKPYLRLSINVYMLNFCILLGQNTMRLWLPQLFASLREFQELSAESVHSMCAILEYNVNKTGLVKEASDTCSVIISPSSYTNNIIVASSCFVLFLLAGTLINKVGHKRIQIGALLISGVCGFALYWSNTTMSTLIITSLYACMGSLSATSAVGTSTVLFPTSLRTMVVCVSLMFGRIGSIFGNVLFPVFMSFGCVPPFLMVGGVMFVACILSALLPSTQKRSMTNSDSKVQDNWNNNRFHQHGDVDIPADYETAVKACGFGRFNLLLLIVALPAVMATVIETAVVSYILPSAECDLNLDLIDKGILNAITYCGMIVSAIGWGYLADTKGRKNLLIFGFLLDVICVMCGAMSQSRTQLMIAKFFGGFVMCGPFAVLMSYLSEFHGNNYRSRIMMIIGIMFATGGILLPVLALWILPKDWNFDILNMNFVAWKIYLAISGIPSLLSGIFLCFYPESPRFLMSQGRNEEALKAFRTMYAVNTGKTRDTYPIKTLINEVQQKNIADVTSVATIETFAINPNLQPTVEANNNSSTGPVKSAKEPNAFRALCFKPYLGLCLRVCLMQFFILLGQNTMRLWLPQMFASINEYEQISQESTSMCNILEYSVNKTELVKNPTDQCSVIITPSTYSNNIIVACAGFITYLVAGTLVNAVGNKRIQVIGLTVAGTSGIALYWSSSTIATLIITSIYVSLGSMSATSSIGTSVNLFPTSLRTMIVSLTMMIGRMGSILGNLLFPIFMSFGCIPPFVMVGVVMYLGCLLAAFLPSTNKLDLK
ncbi:uncharacterized protein LOC142231188 [Haematobia irritans]|uniref:uncharacterized protein LOC142231188 n=1 Tax=Haematobia irritans TaxID=7368 RepID=UPI003F4F6612